MYLTLAARSGPLLFFESPFLDTRAYQVNPAKGTSNWNSSSQLDSDHLMFVLRQNNGSFEFVHLHCHWHSSWDCFRLESHHRWSGYRQIREYPQATFVVLLTPALSGAQLILLEWHGRDKGETSLIGGASTPELSRAPLIPLAWLATPAAVNSREVCIRYVDLGRPSI